MAVLMMIQDWNADERQF